MALLTARFAATRVVVIVRSRGSLWLFFDEFWRILTNSKLFHKPTSCYHTLTTRRQVETKKIELGMWSNENSLPRKLKNKKI